MFLVVINSHSKWPEVVEMKSTSSTATILELRRMFATFATYGIPEQLVSDNGPQFISKEFEIFLCGNGVRHIRCARYHPASNGQAERFVQTFKRHMKAGCQDLPLHQRLMTFLLISKLT